MQYLDFSSLLTDGDSEVSEDSRYPRYCDILGYDLMWNHIHLILRTRPDLAASWSPGEVRSIKKDTRLF